MTTIAYNFKDKEIAVDGRFTRGDMVTTDEAAKIIKKDGVSFILAGASASYCDLVDMWFSGDVNPELDCSAFVICGGVVYDYGLDPDGNLSKEAIDENLTKGSGGLWAYAAMDFGCSAKGAVKYAMTRDVYTGGKIRVIKVK